MIPFLIVIVLAILLVSTCVKIVPQAHACVIERLGVYKQTWSVGIHFKVPFLDRISRRVNLKEQVADFEPQPVITRDNVTMQIDTIIFYQTLSFMHTVLKILLLPLKTLQQQLLEILLVI